MNFRNTAIGTRMALGFAVILILLTIIAALGLSRLALVKDELTRITTIGNVEVDLVASMRDTVNLRSIAARNAVLLTKADEIRRELERIREQAAQYETAKAKLVKLFMTSSDHQVQEQELLNKIGEDALAAQAIIDRVVELSLANDDATAIPLLVYDMRPLQQKWRADLTSLIALETRKIAEDCADAELTYQNARSALLLLTLAAIALGSAMAVYITLGITRPLKTAVKLAQAVAGGDLTTRIEIRSKDETGKLMQALHDMNASLQQIVAEVRDGTHTIASASSQIAGGNLDLSSRTEQQASSLQETASSMEELTSTVRHSAEHARHASALAASATDVAAKGGNTVAEVVGTMHAIHASSRKIADIISVIDAIAFQTNILALNAAVEAARAGEQGRGFAIVATEVRGLAQRSATAAREIKVLIGDSLAQVEAGVKLVGLAGTDMQAIVHSIGQVGDIMAGLSSATQEQSTGIEQINLALTQMDQVTQQNAALVEEAAASAESLREQARKLTGAINVFKLEASTTTEDFTAHKAALRPRPHSLQNASKGATRQTVIYRDLAA